MKKKYKLSLINKLVIKSFKENKLRNYIVFFLVTVITAVMAGLFIITNSLFHNLQNHYIKQLQSMSIEITSVYNGKMISILFYEAMPFLFGILLTFVSGFIILYNVLCLSVTGNIQFYARLKILGASAREIRKVFYRQINFLALIAIPFGLLCGNVLGSSFVPVLLGGKLEKVFVYTNGWLYAISVILVLLNLLLASIIPSIKAGKINSSDGFQREMLQKNKRKTSHKYPGLPALFQLSIANLGRNKRSLFTVIITITIGIVMIGSVYVVDKSFDVKKYIKAVSISDFTIMDESLTFAQGKYNEKGKTITADLVSKIKEQGVTTDEGMLYSQEYEIELNNNSYENIINFYEEEGKDRLKYMSGDVLWMNGYHKMKKEHNVMSILYGINGLLIDVLKRPENILEGSIDLKKFYSGKYAIAQGIAGSKDATKIQPTVSIGEKIFIEQKEFEIMAIVEVPIEITQGKGSDESSFSLGFFIPDYEFTNIFSENTMRKYFFNVVSNKGERIENFLIDYKGGTVPYISEKVVKENYQKETSAMTVVAWAVSIIVVLIGLLNMLNSIVVMINSRKIEFTMMQSIGMTKKQLKMLLLFESINFSFITLIIAYFVSLLIISFGVKAYLDTQWSSTYTFSITPLLIFTPILIFYGISCALFTLHYLLKKDLPDRMNHYNF